MTSQSCYSSIGNVCRQHYSCIGQWAMDVDNTIYLKAMYTDNKTTLPQLYTDSDTVNKIQLTIIYALRYPVEITYIICLSTHTCICEQAYST